MPLPSAPHPDPSPREGVNEASAGRGRGRSYAHRCQQVFPWWPYPGLAPLRPCLSALPARDGGWCPSGLGWGPFTCLGPARTPPWRPRVCVPKTAVFPTPDPWVGPAGQARQVGLRSPRPGQTSGAEGISGRWRGVSPRASETWSPLAFFSLHPSQLGLCLSSSLFLGDSGVKEFVV